MTKFFCTKTLLIPVVVFLAGCAEVALGQTYVAGRDYTVIEPPQPVANPDKIEVIEFFWYGCPHCYSFEPYIKAWLQQKPQDVEFIRQPAVFASSWAIHARAFFAMQAIGVTDQVHAEFFDFVQNRTKKKRLGDTDIFDFMKQHGVDRDKFASAFKSFAVSTKMRQAEILPPRYGVTGVPSVVVDGKYRVDVAKARGLEHMLEIASFLIDEVRRTKSGSQQ